MLGVGLGIPFAQPALIWTPALLPKPTLGGGWFNLSNASTVTTSGGNVSTVADSFGSGRTLATTAAPVPLGTDPGTGKQYARFLAANFSGTYPGLSGAVMSTASNAPWTVSFILEWEQGPSSSSNTQFASFAYLGGGAIGSGGGGAGGSPVLFSMGPATVYGAANSTSANVLSAGAGVWQPFGRETLATGASGASIPSRQVVTYRFDGSVLSLWIDGVLQPTQSGGNGGTRTGLSITLDTAMLAVGPWYNLGNTADRKVFEVLAVDYAMSTAQIKQLAAYAQRTYGIAQTATKALFLGDSVEFGSISSSPATAYNALFPQILAQVFNFPIVVANLAITGTSLASWLNSKALSVTFNNFDWQEASDAMGYSPMSVLNIAGEQSGGNDIVAGTALATFQAQDAQAAGILRGWGFKKLLRTNLVPADATLIANQPPFGSVPPLGVRPAFNAYMRAAVGSTWDALQDWDASGDTTALPGVSAWSNTTAYNAAASGGPPWIVTFGGVAYWARASSTGITPGTDSTKWVPLDGAATVAACVATMLDATGIARGDSEHLHGGYNAAQGDFGPVVCAYYRAIAVARMLGLM